MSNTAKEFGPFTPQELERVVDWLQAEQLEFKISKDQKTEDLFRTNDPQNLVNARFRTEVYLAQIFSVSVENMSGQQELSFKKEFSLSEVIPSRFQAEETKSTPGVITFPAALVDHERLEANRRKKIFWSIVGAIAMIVPIAYSLFNILKTSGE